jgi:hypothetical protein
MQKQQEISELQSILLSKQNSMDQPVEEMKLKSQETEDAS